MGQLTVKIVQLNITKSMGEAGRPTELDDELMSKIGKLFISGKTLQQIAQILNINYFTLDGWSDRNYKGFRENLQVWRHERMLRKAEENLEHCLQMEEKVDAIGMFGPIKDKVTGQQVKKINTEILKVKQDTAKFVSETLGRRHYAKRNELAGPDNKPIPILATIQSNVPSNNSNQENNGNEEKDKSDTGRDISKQDDQHTPILDSSSTVGQNTNTN